MKQSAKRSFSNQSRTLTATLILSLAAPALAFRALPHVRKEARLQARSRAASRLRPRDVHPGDLDTTFGTNGKVSTDFNGDRDQGFAVVIQPDGRIVVAGSAVVTAGQPADFALARYNSDGSLDTTFGAGGKVTTDFGGNDQASAIALQPDGKIVAAGGTCSNSVLGCTEMTGSGFDFAIARYNSDGSLDTTFGSGGKVTTDFNGGMDIASSVIVQPDGRIVVGGAACEDSSAMCADSGGIQFALARYNANGSLDTTFGTGGKVFTHVLTFGACLALTLQSDGKIVAGGLAFQPAPRFDADFELVRYNADGSLDSSFGSGGMVNTDFNSTSSVFLYDAASAVAVQPDGKILAAGASETNTPPDFNYEFSVARYNADGTLDSSFGTGGKAAVAISANNNDQAGSVLIQPDGRILVGGEAGGFTDISIDQVVIFDTGTPPGSNFALVRLNANGTVDTGFGNAGIVTTDFFGSSDAGRFTLGPDGKVVGAGFARHAAGAAFRGSRPRGILGAAVAGWAASAASEQQDADFALARYETGITPQPDFSISFVPSSVTATKPQVVAAPVNVTRTGGFTGTVTIAPQSLPGGVVVKGGSVSTSGSSATIRLKVKGKASTGSDALTFIATDSSGRTRTATLTLVVQ